MSGALVARAVRTPRPDEPPPWDLVTLDHDGRTLRREVVETVHGARVLVDLAAATTLRHGELLALEDGRTVEVIAAEEDLTEVRAAEPTGLARLAWHLGNRHLPTQIEPDRLLIRRDPVIERMLAQRGARLAAVREPFHPEGGAYAHGAAPAHAQGRDHDHGRDHGHGHGHGRDHAHDHDHAHEHDHGRRDPRGHAHG
jgi:urease accessory protein